MSGGIRECRGVRVYWGWQGLHVLRGTRGVGALGAPRGLGGARGHFGGVRGQQGCRGCQGCIGGGKWTGSQPHWAPVQGPSTPTGSPGGVTYLAKAKQVTEMSSAGYYTHFELYFMTVFIFVSMPPHHIFLHTILGNVLWTIFSADQFTHIVTQSMWHIMTQWYYLWTTTFLIRYLTWYICHG